MKQSVVAVVVDEKEPIGVDDLATFLYLFEGLYNHARRVSSGADMGLQALVQNTAEVKLEVERSLAALSVEQIEKVFETSSVDEDRLEIQGIKKQSPLVVIFCGVLSALVVAVIFSGGELKVSPLRISVKISSLGEGIKKLREAFNLPNQTRLGFTLLPHEVRLSKYELEVLDRDVKGSGGFQNLFRALQKRVNRRNRYLLLYPREIEAIIRAASKSGKGGFQGRALRVFGRHLDLGRDELPPE